MCVCVSTVKTIVSVFVDVCVCVLKMIRNDTTKRSVPTISKSKIENRKSNRCPSVCVCVLKDAGGTFLFYPHPSLIVVSVSFHPASTVSTLSLSSSSSTSKETEKKREEGNKNIRNVSVWINLLSAGACVCVAVHK